MKASKHFTSDFAIEFWFDSPVDAEEETMSPLNDWIDATQSGGHRHQSSLDMMKLHLRDIRSENVKENKRRERPQIRKVHSNDIRGSGKVRQFPLFLFLFLLPLLLRIVLRMLPLSVHFQNMTSLLLFTA